MRRIKMKQGRIHGKNSHVRLGRSSDAKTARKTPKKQMRYRPTDGRTDGQMDGLTDPLIEMRGHI